MENISEALKTLKTLLSADDIPETHKESLRQIEAELISRKSKISNKEIADYLLRIAQILSTLWKFFD